MGSEPTVRIQWLGHSTFLMTAPTGDVLLVDPFLDSSPVCPEECKAPARVDVIAVSHGHQDHVADLGAVYAQHHPTVVCMVEVAAWLRRTGIDDAHVTEMNKGGTVDLGWVTVSMVDACHSNGIADGDRLVYGGEAAGLVLSFPGGPCVYHAGDTDVFLGMSLIRELYAPDLALLPIGGHYTMGPRGAAKACELLGVDRVAPMHYGTWPILAGTPDELRQECAARGLEVDVVAVEPGATLP